MKKQELTPDDASLQEYQVVECMHAYHSRGKMCPDSWPEDPADWVFYVDCDAFFTNFDVRIADILATYNAEESVGFLVAEDPGGINTGTLLFRNIPWTLDYLARVLASPFHIAWDQSRFFLELLKPELFKVMPEDPLAEPKDFQLPSPVRFVHQAHFNAFVPPASVDWHAYEWQQGDFVRHFAGCPWQEKHCLRLMQETAELARPPPPPSRRP
mmetsp:Transcript_15767/g.37054  ORF Transcript_15767/g.37054 Transcript_15767/m.37054 type:complete len:213 (-) Transcript_15767:180-818(-)